MKIKKNPLRRDKRVYYFKHKHGVLTQKKHTPFSVLSHTVAMVAVLGGLGFGAHTALTYEPKAKPVYQREGTVATVEQASGQSTEKLKSAELKAREDEQLVKNIKSKLRNVPGGQKWSVYVRDLNSDRMASINADNTIDASGGLASLFTIAPLEAKMPSTNWRYKYGKQSVEECVVALLKTNDSTCAQMVRQNANIKNADNVNDKLGFKKTSISGKKQTTTARETGDLLFRLQNSQVLSDKARRVTFDGLYGHKSREGIPTGCDQKCLIANITNDTNGGRSDAAIVTSGASKYIVVISTSDASWSQIADVSAAIRLIMQP